TENDAELAECRSRFKEQLLPQMAADGSFPQELRRTKPYCYSEFNLDQMTMLCYLISTPQDDLWHFVLPNGATLQKGAEFMYPYIADKSKWPPNAKVRAQDVMWWQYWPVRSCTWLLAGLEYNEPKYIDLWKSLDANPTNEEVLRNLPIRQPVIWAADPEVEN
ncbi:MAG TPA: alginate lyase family protein, partial [Tepidisphaeraceae bacterium]|nr:alginate lyase family protein [Tepidisphaeraceae bacterium]